VSRLDDGGKKRISQIVLHLAFSLRRLRRFIGDDPSATMPTFFTPADATIVKRFGVGRVEVPATALRARDPSITAF
jgi:hypothetical protein